MTEKQLENFLKDFHISDSQLHELYKRFCAEIRKGLSKETHAKSDIKCFTTYVQDLPTGDELGKYLALDLGGTNFRVLLVTLEGHHDAVVESKIYAVSKEIMTGTGNELFDHIAKCLADFVHERGLSNARLPLGFTFSFPCIQKGLTNASLVRWTKGFQCSGVVNVDVVKLLQDAIVRRGDVEIEVIAVLNDTTGTLMSCAHRNPQCRVGVIVGTGCNACYVEQNDKVELLDPKYKQDKTQILINTEWGAFGESGSLEFIRTDYDRHIDKMSLNAGKQLYEKMISGMYLGELARLILIKAIDENLIFVRVNNKENLKNILSNVECFETRFISEIEADTFPEFKNTRHILKELFGLEKATVEDCQKLRIICECIAKRAAALVAVGVSGLINRVDEANVVVGVDGSVYRFHPKFDAYMRQTMYKLVNSKTRFDLMLSEDGSGRGAALVAAVACQSN